MKKIQIGNTEYEVNVIYDAEGEVLEKLIEQLILYKIKVGKISK